MSVATTEWLQKELGTIRGLVDDNTDDFSYAARRDLEWINEHMDDVLDTRFSLSTLLQTPGRLKGAPSPRKARLMARAPQSGPLSPKSVNSMNTGFRKAVARELEYKQHRDSARPESRLKELSTNASASTVTIFSDGSPDASFHSAEDVAEPKPEDATNMIELAAGVHEDMDIDASATTSTPDEEFTFTALPAREPLTAKTPGSDTLKPKPSATSLRVQRIRQHLEKSSGGKFSSMIIDGDDDFTQSAAIEKKPQSASPVASRSPVVAHVAPAQVQVPTSSIPGAIPPHMAHRQLNSPIKLRNPNTGSPSKVGSLYPPVSPSKSAAASSNHGHFFSGAIRRAKMLLFQDDKKENSTPQTPKQPSANISRLMAPTASSQARSPVRASPSKLYPEIRSPTKIPEPRQPASPTRIASPVRVASGASSVASLDLNTPMVLRQPSVKAANTRTSRVPVPKAAERFTRRQAEIRAKEEREREQKEQKEREKEQKDREHAAAVAEREQARLVAAAEEQRQRQAAAEKEAQLERERKERAERAQRARRERLLRERQERKEKEEREEKERVEREEREREERLEQERLQKERFERVEQERAEHERRLRQERIEQDRLEQERLEQERIQEELLEEARLESIRLEKENQQRLQQQRKRPSAVADDEQQQPQKVHLSNMRKPLSSSTRVSQNHRVSSSMVDSPLTKQTAGGSLMRQSLQRQQYKTQMGMAQSKFGKAAEGVTISTESIKFASSTTASSAAPSAAASAAAAAAAAATPLKRVVGPNRPQHTTPQQFRSQRTGAFSSSMSFQAKLFKQSASAAPTSAPTPVAADPMTPAASHVPVTQLPEINSDSEDDEGDGILRDWANSPELRSLLQRQQGMDPDRIFGPLPPLQMEEIFGSSNSARVAKFRGRSSSANWSRDQLSQFEIDSYSEQMGYK